MRAHYLQHVQFEGLGSLESSLKAVGYEITHTSLFSSTELPSIDDIELLLVMGGPMSVNAEAEFPWLIEEKKFIHAAIQSGMAVIGVCLGAQLIASAMGAKVYQNRVKEIGWFPLYGVSPSDDPHFRFPPSIDVFHWHGETFDLPSGATLLASSEGCKNQAFQLGRSVIGLQFHLETTPESAHELVVNCRDELISATHVQTEDEILSVPPEEYKSLNLLMDEIVLYLQHSGI